MMRGDATEEEKLWEAEREKSRAGFRLTELRMCRYKGLVVLITL